MSFHWANDLMSVYKQPNEMTMSNSKKSAKSANLPSLFKCKEKQHSEHRTEQSSWLCERKQSKLCN